MEHADETSKHGDPEKLPTGGALPTSGEVVRPFTTCKRYVGFSHSSKSCCALSASDGFQSRMRFAVKDFVLFDLLSGGGVVRGGGRGGGEGKGRELGNGRMGERVEEVRRRGGERRAGGGASKVEGRRELRTSKEKVSKGFVCVRRRGEEGEGGASKVEGRERDFQVLFGERGGQTEI